MITSGEDYVGGAPLKTQVCIVGTGPAGVTLAWHLVQQGIEVALFAGEPEFWPVTGERSGPERLRAE